MRIAARRAMAWAAPDRPPDIQKENLGLAESVSLWMTDVASVSIFGAAFQFLRRWGKAPASGAQAIEAEA